MVNCVDVYCLSLCGNGNIVDMLKSVLSQKEVMKVNVICDSYSDEEYESIVNSIKDNKLFFYKKPNNINKKNSPIKKGGGEFISFVDENIIYPDNYFSTMITQYNIYGGVISLSGKQINTFPLNVNDNIEKISCCDISDVAKCDIINGSTSFFSRDIFNKEELYFIYKKAFNKYIHDINISIISSRNNIDRYVVPFKSIDIDLYKMYSGHNNDIKYQISCINRDYMPYQKRIDGVSICITAYNTAEYIKECIDSVYAQDYFKTHKNFEVIIGVDACQKTLEAVRPLLNLYDNLRIVMMDSNKGTYVTSNTIMKISRYSWILRFDSDDIMNSDMISSLIKNGGDIIRMLYIEFGDNNPTPKDSDFYAYGIVMFKGDIFDKFGGFRNYKCGSDSDFLNRFKNIKNISYVNKILFKRRMRENSLTRDKETSFESEYRKNIFNILSTYKYKIESDSIIDCVTNTFKYIDEYEEKIIITMTTWKQRISNIPIVLKNILNQTIKPDKIVINVAIDEFPNKEEDFPDDVNLFLNKHKNMIDVNWVQKNNRVWKKILPTMQMYPCDCIICIDDDFIYTPNMIETLINAHNNNMCNPISGGVGWKYKGMTQHCGYCSLDMLRFYSMDIFKYISDELYNYNSSDTFYTFVANKNNNSIINTYITFESFNGVFGHSNIYKSDLIVLWNYLENIYKRINDKISIKNTVIIEEKKEIYNKQIFVKDSLEPNTSNNKKYNILCVIMDNDSNINPSTKYNTYNAHFKSFVSDCSNYSYSKGINFVKNMNLDSYEWILFVHANVNMCGDIINMNKLLNRLEYVTTIENIGVYSPSYVNVSSVNPCLRNKSNIMKEVGYVSDSYIMVRKSVFDKLVFVPLNCNSGNGLGAALSYIAKKGGLMSVVDNSVYIGLVREKRAFVSELTRDYNNLMRDNKVEMDVLNSKLNFPIE